MTGGLANATQHIGNNPSGDQYVSARPPPPLGPNRSLSLYGHLARPIWNHQD